jgi:hypothetical protein
MSTENDLAAWGEPPPTEEEKHLAALLDTVLSQRQQGPPAPVATVKPAASLTGSATTMGVDVLARSALDLMEGMRQLQAVADPSACAPSEDSESRPPGDALPEPFPGEFRARSWLGRGSFGRVFLADDLNLGIPVAIKTLPRPGKSAALSQALTALRNDARALAGLRHRNIIQVYAWRQAGEDHFLVLQYVAGGSLQVRLEREGPLPWHLATRYAADVGEGLLEAHRRGLIHRDVKPANMLWDSEADEALLTDFGVAALLGGAHGSTAGTPAYMAPEAFAGQVTPALDVYGLAASLFHLITGELPFPAEQLSELCRAAQRGLPDPDRRCAAMPGPLEAVVRAGLTPDPTRRPSLREFVARLRGTLNLLLADSFALRPLPSAGGATVDLRLLVSRQTRQGTFEPVATTHPPPEQLVRNMKRVPRPPAQVRLRTGDQVRVEVVADRPGYPTVFNVGPEGAFNLLYPADPLAAAVPVALATGEALHVVDVEMTPLTGRERLVAVWSRQPLPVRIEELLGSVEPSGSAPSGEYQATRGMLRVLHGVQGLRPEDWQAVVLELDHCPE